MSSLFADMRRKADEVTLEADKKIRITRKKGEINQMRKKIRHKITELGDLSYQLHRTRKAVPSEIANECVAIDALYSEIQAKEEEIEAISREKLPPPPPVHTIVCQNCYRAFPDTATFCPHCGGQRVASQPMITCENCGKQLPAEARFCAHCGALVNSLSQPSSKFCRQCNTELAESALFCPECGTRVETAGGESRIPQQAEIVTDDSSIQKIEAKQCPQCGTELQTDATFCPECNEAVSKNAVVEPLLDVDSGQASAPSEPIDESVDIAPIFQKNNGKMDKAETPVQDTQRCPSCSIDIPTEALFCPVCGATIS